MIKAGMRVVIQTNCRLNGKGGVVQQVYSGAYGSTVDVLIDSGFRTAPFDPSELLPGVGCRVRGTSVNDFYTVDGVVVERPRGNGPFYRHKFYVRNNEGSVYGMQSIKWLGSVKAGRKPISAIRAALKHRVDCVDVDVVSGAIIIRGRAV